MQIGPSGDYFQVARHPPAIGGKPASAFSERLLATMNAETVRDHLAATVAQKGYSYLNATIGLTRIARRAGM